MKFKGSTTVLVVPTEDIEFSGLTIPVLVNPTNKVYDGIRVIARTVNQGVGGGDAGNKSKNDVIIKKLRTLADWLEKINFR